MSSSKQQITLDLPLARLDLFTDQDVRRHMHAAQRKTIGEVFLRLKECKRPRLENWLISKILGQPFISCWKAAQRVKGGPAALRPRPERYRRVIKARLRLDQVGNVRVRRIRLPKPAVPAPSPTTETPPTGKLAS